MSSNLNVLSPGESDFYIETMMRSDFMDIGSPSWLQWHKRLQELNQQAVIEAADFREESVKDMLISHMKVPELVHEALAISVWRHYVLPRLMKLRPKDCPTNLTIYIVLMHEVVSVSLLETVMFHSDSCVQLGDKIIDLMDYAVESVCAFVSLMHSDMDNTKCVPGTSGMGSTSTDDADDFKNQQQNMQFQRGTLCASILCYIIEHLPRLQAGVAARMMTVHDVPLLLTELVYLQPWTKKDDNGWCKYINGKWQRLSGEEIVKVGVMDGQIWLGLRQLLLDSSVMSYYDLTDFRRVQLSKLQKYLHDILVDQIPPLGELKHFIVALSLTGNPSSYAKKPMLLEVVPEIRRDIVNKFHKKWDEVASKQADVLFPKDHESMVDIAKILSSSYSNEALEHFDQQGLTKCGNCGKSASKKCSRCKGEWYCGRECQLERWALHKDICDQIVKINKVQ